MSNVESMQREKMDLIGSSLDGFDLIEELGDGAFSVVYEGRDSEGKKRAFKVARSKPLYKAASTGCFLTEALVAISGAIGTGQPSGQALLKKQYELMSTLGGALLAAEKFQAGEQSYLRMNLVEGASLRELMRKDSVSLDCLFEVANALANTFKAGTQQYHGDLKPENILISQEKCVLIDPGYFGELEDFSGKKVSMKVTTREYYPLLVPNDIMAFGLVMLEIVLQKNLLAQRCDSTELSLDFVGRELLDKIRREEWGYNYSFTSILRLSGRSPEAIKLIGSPLHKIILKALGLEIDSNDILELAPAYSDFSELRSDLKALKSGLNT